MIGWKMVRMTPVRRLSGRSFPRCIGTFQPARMGRTRLLRNELRSMPGSKKLARHR
jgi:hypothetical protein